MAETINKDIQAYVEATQAAFTTINTTLDGVVTITATIATGVGNIAGDEKNLVDLVQSLKDQIAAGGSKLTQVDKDALNNLLTQAQAMSVKTTAVVGEISKMGDTIKALADAVPDPPPPPPL